MTQPTRRWRTRLRAIYTVARGRPCAYRLIFDQGVLSFRETRGAYVAECVFKNLAEVSSRG